MNDTGKLMMTLTAGFAAGVVAGILFAPEVGEKTRESIKSKAAELGDELDKHYQAELDKLKDKVSDLTKELKQKVAASGLEEKADEVKAKVMETAADLSGKVSETASDLKEKVAQATN